jgi:polysaccharide chain length determinant protein (PEP-CTERM system associated)
MQSETEQRLRVLYREAFARRKWVVGAFMVITAIAVAMGVNWPKQYESSSTILVEGQSIIEPLMRGAAVRGDVGDLAGNAREIIYGRSMMLKVLEHGDWLANDPTPAQVEQLVEQMRERTTIAQVGHNLIRIEFSGADPERVYETTDKLAQLFVEETLAARAKESNAAFEFIDGQVAKYEQELAAAEARLKALRQRHEEARPGAEAESTERVARMRTNIEEIEQQIREAQIRRDSLQDQLSGEATVAAVASQAQQYRTRIAQLKQQLDTLRLTYHDTYPDVVQLKFQISELEKAVAAEEQRTRAERRQAQAEGRSYVDESMRSNPVYQELQSALYDANTQIRTLQARLQNTRRNLEQELALAQRIQDVQAEFTGLTRDYEVNQGIYQDLLRRRENARVSMNLNTEQEGLNLRIVEPAYFSHTPAGPRLVHFAFGGLLLGAALPIGLLFGLLLVDPRVRTGTDITHELGLPLLETVPRMDTPREAQAERRGLMVSAALVALTVAAVIVVLVLRLQGEV